MSVGIASGVFVYGAKPSTASWCMDESVSFLDQGSWRLTPLTLQSQPVVLHPPSSVVLGTDGNGHCIVCFSGGGSSGLIDHSSNGTTINGIRVQEGEAVSLNDGDVLCLASPAEFRVQRMAPALDNPCQEPEAVQTKCSSDSQAIMEDDDPVLDPRLQRVLFTEKPLAEAFERLREAFTRHDVVVNSDRKLGVIQKQAALRDLATADLKDCVRRIRECRLPWGQIYAAFNTSDTNLAYAWKLYIQLFHRELEPLSYQTYTQRHADEHARLQVETRLGCRIGDSDSDSGSAAISEHAMASAPHVCYGQSIEDD